ncbi:ATP-binding cassette sub-family G member 4 [Eumeta japonica]|uniref:ATP-binding cassette sub-family G member 4 n=1 Tax=Eumeta variegata TaxID=151549 RepID=A0A4C1Y3T3_EUMVA|nr:ATP-binding cassette sub-family G member 4 [Eumeta japonica]
MPKSSLSRKPVTPATERAGGALRVYQKINRAVGRLQKRFILKGLSGTFRSGELTAIMGPSGAGKTSLMNALTGFAVKGVKGRIEAGDSICVLGKRHGSTRSLKEYRKKSCYILQEERLIPLFTVAELMRFAADLKLGSGATESVKQDVTTEALKTLNLTGSENTRCGNLSGGQKKRLSIALDFYNTSPHAAGDTQGCRRRVTCLMDDPLRDRFGIGVTGYRHGSGLLYLPDAEAAGGLDSSSSTQCVKLLKRLARGGRTVVCTIHQPTASVYALFDQVYVLAGGRCVYHGSNENTVPYLGSAGFHCPMYHNPADYLLEVANGEYGEVVDVLVKENLKRDWRKKRAPRNVSSNKKDGICCEKNAVAMKSPNEFYKFFVLIRRCMIQQYRDWTVTHLKVLLHFLVGIILGLLYKSAGNDGSKVISNIGYLMVSLVYLSYTSLMPAVLRFPQELPVLKKENFNNWYDLKTYYIAVLLTSIPMQVSFSIVYCSPSYFISEQPADPKRFLMFILVCTVINLLTDAFGNIIGTCVNPINGTFLGAISLCAMLVYGGYFVFLRNMNAVMRLVSYVSFLRYAFEALVISMYSGGRPPLECRSMYCHYRYPKQLLQELDFDPDNYWLDATVLFCMLCDPRGSHKGQNGLSEKVLKSICAPDPFGGRKLTPFGTRALRTFARYFARAPLWLVSAHLDTSTRSTAVLFRDRSNKSTFFSPGTLFNTKLDAPSLNLASMALHLVTRGGRSPITKFVTEIDTTALEFCKPVINGRFVWSFIAKSSSKPSEALLSY